MHPPRDYGGGSILHRPCPDVCLGAIGGHPWPGSRLHFIGFFLERVVFAVYNITLCRSRFHGSDNDAWFADRLK